MHTFLCYGEARMATEQTIAPLENLEALEGLEPLPRFEPLDSFESLVSTLRAIAEPTRLRLVILLGRAELTVTEISQVIGQSQPRTSRHLRLLLDADVLERTPERAWRTRSSAARSAAMTGSSTAQRLATARTRAARWSRSDSR